MMDASDMYPTGFHPVQQRTDRNFRGEAPHYTRTLRPPKYFFTDFSNSQHFPANDPPLPGPSDVGDPRLPGNEEEDPFLKDVYNLGNLIRRDFLVGDIVLLLCLHSVNRRII
jgi:hypothetical protein